MTTIIPAFKRPPTYINGVRSTSVIPVRKSPHSPPATKPNGGLRGSTATRR